MGLGQFGGGAGVARHLAEHGARVCVTDLGSSENLRHSCDTLKEWPIRFVLGKHDEADFQDADLVVANPAVPQTNRFLRLARDRGIPVTSEMELFLHSTRAEVLLVSGTHGKSSTVTFLNQLLGGLHRPVFLGGNIGKSLLNEPGAMDANARCVIEISSYQLEALGPALPKARGAGLTALAPDHLERHGTLEEYLRCKARIFEWLPEGAPALLPADSWDRPPFADLRTARPDLAWQAYGPDQDLGIREGRLAWGSEDFGPVSAFQAQGEFQRQNLLLALGLAAGAGAPAAHLAERIPHLTGPPHRLQPLPPGPGPRIFDNGVSTTPETTLAAVRSLPAPLVLLIGGKAKAGLPYPELAAACAARGDRVHLFGAACEDLGQIFAPLGPNLYPQPRFEDAVQAAWDDCQPAETLLFSPACASFDAFPNFQARARLFLETIEALRSKHSGS